MINVALQMLVRDNRDYIKNGFIPYFEEFEKTHPHINLHYYFLENDSCDGSEVIISDFLAAHPGVLKSSALGVLEKSAAVLSPESAAKMHKMAGLRTELNALIEDHSKYDFILFVDTDILFTTDAIKQFIKTLTENPEIGQISGNGAIRDGTWKGLYYDTWACEFLDGKTPHGHSKDPALFPQGCTSKLIKGVYGFMIPLNHPVLLYVNSAFGGASMTRAKLAQDFKWSASGKFEYTNIDKKFERSAVCEHKSFCEHVREQGYKVSIDPAAQVTWTRNENIDLTKISAAAKFVRREVSILNTIK